MTLTVRLKPELEARLAQLCERRRVTKSEVVEGLIREYVAREPEVSSYQAAAKLGIVGLGRGPRRALGRNAKALVRGIVDAKHRR
jgi:FixJ family two-component response regulator